MNRKAVQAALRRATPAAPCLRIARQTTAPFSSTASRPDDVSDRQSRSQAAARKLAELGNKPKPSSPSGPSSNNNNSNGGQQQQQNQQQRARAPIRRAQGAASAPRGGIIDARSLRAAPIKPASAGTGGAGGGAGALATPKILNLRSIRGSLGRGSLRFAGPGGTAGPTGRPARFGLGLGGAGRVGGGRFGGAGRAGAGAGRGGGAGGARGRRSGRPRRRGDGEGGSSGRQDGDANWKKLTPEEQEVVDRLEQGEVVRFDPKLTLADLSGYGPPVATDAALGRVETAIRAMRVMTGGMAFNADSGVTADVTAIMKRYEKKLPIFVHSQGEREWIERAKPKHQLVGPSAETKKAIIDTAILGKYEPSPLPALGDVKATMANYHQRTFTYRASDSERFISKVLSLMPAQAGGKPAAQAKTA